MHGSVDLEPLGMTEGDDVGRECSGNTEAFEQMLGTMNHGGRIALLGILPGKTAIQWSNVLFKGLVLKGVYGREMVETWYEMATLLRSGKVVLDWTSGPPQA